MLNRLIEMNFSTLTVIAFMTLFLALNSMFRKNINRVFGFSIFLTIIEMIVYSVELWTAEFDSPTDLRILMSAIGYSVRPLIIFSFIVMIKRNNIYGKKLMYILPIPLIINTIVAFSAFFTDIAYSYDENNNFVRGPMGYFSHAVITAYLFILLMFTVKSFRNKRYTEALVIFEIAAVNVIAMFTESALKLHGVARSAYSLSIVFYYLFFNVESFKRDALTGALNRRCFYMDAEKNANTISAVVSIDLNNLKYINDNLGHAKGDEAICTLVNCISKVIPKSCDLYRTGGDEFIILCIKTEQSAVEKMIVEIRGEMDKTEYSCAIGAAYSNRESFESICKRADDAMYEDKQRIKSLSAQ